jgi:natural product precursor
MKKINLKGISEILSEKEMKNVMGGSDDVRAVCSGLCNDGQIHMCWTQAGGDGTCKNDSNGVCGCNP